MRDQTHTPCVSIPREHRDRAGPAYILIHQACLAHTAVAEDDNLFAFALETCSPGPEAVRRGAKSHLEENLLARSHDGRAVGSMMQQLSIRRRRGRACDRTASTQRAVRSGRPKKAGYLAIGFAKDLSRMNRYRRGRINVAVVVALGAISKEPSEADNEGSWGC